MVKVLRFETWPIHECIAKRPPFSSSFFLFLSVYSNLIKAFASTDIMASPVRKLIYYGIIEHLKLILRGINVIMLLLTNNKKPSSSVTTTSRDLTTQKKHRVAIVGASFAGCKVEQMLSHYSETFDIIWIDEKEYFEYIPGSLRCFVEPNHFKCISCELSEISTNFMQAKVTDVPTSKTLILSDGETVPFDSLVLCNGSTYADTTVKTLATKRSLDRLASYNSEARNVRDAKTIIIIGAGAVGVELAAELLAKRGQRRIIVVDMAETILNGFPDSTIRYATRYLEHHRIELHLGTKLNEISEKFIVFGDGTKLSADIVYRCMGSKPNTDLLQNSILKNALTGPRQSIAVNDQLQVEGIPHVYCAGDVMHHEKSDEIKLGHTAEVNAIFVAETIIEHYVHGKPPEQRSYPKSVVENDATPFIYCISLGKYDGTLGFNGLVVNGFLAAVLKWIIEWTKVAAVRKQPIGIFFWQFGDFVSNLIGRSILPTKVTKQN